MYPPKHHQDNHPEHCKEVAKNYPFATIISIKDNSPFITHTPLILQDDILLGHIDANNPQVELLKNDQSVTTIFSGPQTYISPSIYTTKQLPTWNYIISHGIGVVKEIKDPIFIKKFMVTMTSYLEGNKQAFTLDIEDPRMDKLIPYIHCFAIEINQWKGKFKISQDKNLNDIEKAKQELIKNNQRNIAEFVNNIYTNHFS